MLNMIMKIPKYFHLKSVEHWRITDQTNESPVSKDTKQSMLLKNLRIRIRRRWISSVCNIKKCRGAEYVLKICWIADLSFDWSVRATTLMKRNKLSVLFIICSNPSKWILSFSTVSRSIAVNHIYGELPKSSVALISSTETHFSNISWSNHHKRRVISNSTPWSQLTASSTLAAPPSPQLFMHVNVCVCVCVGLPPAPHARNKKQRVARAATTETRVGTRPHAIQSMSCGDSSCGRFGGVGVGGRCGREETCSREIYVYFLSPNQVIFEKSSRELCASGFI